MKEVTRYQCEFCKKDFRTPDKHYCKKNPELKNCFTCKNARGWHKGETVNVGFGPFDGPYEQPYPDCIVGEGENWDIETIKEVKYDMQCDKWEQGTYDWRKDFNEYEGMEGLW